MDPQKLRLLIRQLKDIQAQAEKITRAGDNSAEAIESFAQYSSELKHYIAKHIDSAEIHAFAAQLPDVNYARIKIQLWQFFIMPYWWIALYQDYQARNESVQEVNQLRGQYATLEVLVKTLVA